MRPTQRWRDMVEREHAQSERLRQESPPDGDHWQPYARRFQADPHHTDDPLLERLRQEVGPGDTLLDVGAGGGRLALPLALGCRRVIAVEPSDSMGMVLRETASEHGIGNVDLVESSWEEAEVDTADVVICVHVLYVVRDVEGFLRKLERHARRRVVAVLFDGPPQSHIYPLWPLVHGEDRLPLPCLPQFQDVLKELRIDARTEMLPAQPAPGFDSLEKAAAQLSRRLLLVPGSAKEVKLREMLPDLLEEVDGVLRLKWARPLQLAMVVW